MLQWFIWFPEFAEFTKFPSNLRKIHCAFLYRYVYISFFFLCGHLSSALSSSRWYAIRLVKWLRNVAPLLCPWYIWILPQIYVVPMGNPIHSDCRSVYIIQSSNIQKAIFQFHRVTSGLHKFLKWAEYNRNVLNLYWWDILPQTIGFFTRLQKRLSKCGAFLCSPLLWPDHSSGCPII